MGPDDDDNLDLEGAIGAALDEQGVEGADKVEQPRQAKRDEPFPKAEDLPAKDAPKEYVREGRRFVLKDGKETEVKEPAKETPAKAWSPLWLKQEHGIEWDKLPEPFRKALEQREREAAQGIEKHASAAKSWEPVNELLKPHAQQLAAAGMTGQQYVTNLVNADAYLRKDPAQALNWLCQQYTGTDLQGLVDWMAREGIEAKKQDPLHQELQAVKQQLAALQAAPQQQALATTNRIISEWSKDKPYFDDLKSTIMGLISADPSVRERFQSNPAATLDSLYEQAQWAHPQIRDSILRDQRKRDVEQARAGMLSPRGSPTPNGSARSSPKMSLEDEIGMLLDGGVV